MENVRSRNGKILSILLFMMLFTGLWFVVGSETSDAASTSYKYLEAVDDGTPDKVGKYYFRFTYDDESYVGTWSYSKKKNSGFKTISKLDGVGSIATDGKTIYYTKTEKLFESDKLCRYIINKKKNKTLKKLTSGEDVHYYLSAAHGKNVYVTRKSLREWSIDTYMYNASSKKYKKVKKAFGIMDQHGKYVIGTTEFRSDTSSYPIRLCTLTSSGVSKGKKLATYGASPTFVKGKLYYAKYSGERMNKVTLYRSAANGSKKAKLGTFSMSDEYGQIIINDIHPAYCIVNYYGSSEAKIYKYTYKTKEMTQIEY